MVDIVGVIKDPSRLRELFGSSPTVIGRLKIDVLRSETPDFGWDIPTHRVDVGFDASDSRYQRPVGVTLDCVLLDPEYSLTNGAQSIIGNEGFDDDDWRTKRDKLMEQIGKNELITIITPSSFDYSDMMVTEIRPDLRPETSGGFFFSIVARRVETVSSEVKGLDVSLIPDELKPEENDQAKKKKDKNKNEGQKPLRNSTEKAQSILAKLLGGQSF